MKSLAIFCVFVTVAALVPISGQVSSGGTARTQHPKKTADRGQNPPLVTPDAPPKDSDTPTLKANPDQQKPTDNPQSVVISKLPPVTIAKVGVDWGTVANYLLVAVGIGGILTAVFTLLAINRQATIAEKTLILQFRPRIVVRGGGVNKGRVVFWITNTGGAKAHLVTCKIRPMLINDNGVYPDLLAGADDLAPGTVFLAGQSILVSVPLDGSIASLITEQDSAFSAIPGAQFRRKIYCVGSIKYRDDIGTTRMTGIFRPYMPGNSGFRATDSNDLEYAD